MTELKKERCRQVEYDFAVKARVVAERAVAKKARSA